jgi:ABC-type branched-subunit amino acid transport system permease subunit
LTYAGGLVIGVGADLLSHYLPRNPTFFSGVPANLPFLVLFVVLLVTPTRRLFEPGARHVRRPRPPVSLSPPVQLFGGIAGALLLVLVPQLVGSRLVLYATGIAFVVIFASLGLLVHTSGQVSLCQMAFAAVGASTFARALHAGFPWPLAVLVAGLVAVPVGAIVAIPAIRLSGVYLAIATFGFGLLLENLFFRTFLMFGVSNSLIVRRPSLPGLHLGTDTGYYYVVLVITALCCTAVMAVRKSRLGRLLRALGDSPAALNAHGANTNLTKLFVFCISAFLAGIAGAIVSPVTNSAGGLSYDFSISLLLIAVLFISGARPVVSAFVAAFLYVVAPGYITSHTLNEYVPVIFGASALLVAIAPSIGLGRFRLSARALQRDGRGPVKARLVAAPDGAV